MRAVALSVWLFMNLVFLGMCGYMYLLWRQYWLHSERQETQHQVSVPTAPAYPYDVQYLDLVVQHGQEDDDTKHNNRSTALRSKKTPRIRSKGSPADPKCRPYEFKNIFSPTHFFKHWLTFNFEFYTNLQKKIILNLFITKEHILFIGKFFLIALSYDFLYDKVKNKNIALILNEAG